MKQEVPAATTAPATAAPMYEYRAKCNKLAITQTVLYALSFVFLYGIFYYGILGLVTGIFGIMATRTPMTIKQVKYVNVYYILNIVLLVFEILMTVVWLYAVIFASKIDHDDSEVTLTTRVYVILIFGLICQVAIVGITYLAIKTSKLLKFELIRNPPQQQQPVVLATIV